MKKTVDDDLFWMPLFIKTYLAAAAGLDNAQSGSLLHSLMHHWLYGPLPNDLEAVSRIMKIPHGPDASSIALATLSMFFSQREDGRWVQYENQRIKDEWLAKRIVFNERAKKAAAARWKNHPKKDASSIPQAMLEDMLEECPTSLTTSTNATAHYVRSSGNESREGGQEPSEVDKSGDTPEKMAIVPRKPAAQRAATTSQSGVTPPEQQLSNGKEKHPKRPSAQDPRFGSFRNEINEYWAGTHKQGSRAPWFAKDGAALAALLQASPSMTLEEFSALLVNRARSPGTNPSAPIYVWIRDVRQYEDGPLDEYKKPLVSRQFM